MATAPEPAAPARPRRPETLGLLVILLAGLLLRVWLASRSSGLTMDSALYVRMAEGLRAGHPLSAPAHQGYPLLIALASLLGGGREWPGRLVSLAASLALIPLVWWTARRRLPALPSLAAAAMVAAHPLLAVYGGSIMTEASFLTLAFAGVSLLDRGRPGWGGALLGASWWVRPEAAVVAPLAILWAPLRGRARLIAALWVLAIALPHSLVLTAAEGRWTLTPKTSLVRAPFEGARSAEWRLADPTAFADTVGLEQRLARDGRSIARAYPARLFAHAARVLDAWPALLLLASFAGCLSGGAGAWLAFLALPLVYPVLSAPADVRFAQLTVPALALLAASGAARAWARDVRGRVLAAAVLLAGLVGLWSPGPASTRALAFDDGPMAAMRGAGAWLAGHSRADAVVMDRKSYVPFFANRRHVQLPDEPLGVMLDFARDSGASHLVVEEYVVRSLRPQLAPLLDADSIRAERRVRLVFATRPAPGDGVAVFEVAR